MFTFVKQNKFFYKAFLNIPYITLAEKNIKSNILSNMKDKIKRATEIYELDKEKAEKEIKRIDKLRANHYKYYTGKDWNDNENYDICINSDALGVERVADLICEIAKEK